MEENKVRIGMKVVPFQKSVGRKTFRQSSTLKKAKEANQEYLYVVGRDRGFWRLNDKNIDKNVDYFEACDFDEYIGENRFGSIKKEELHKEIHGKLISSINGKDYGYIGTKTTKYDIYGNNLRIGDIVSFKGVCGVRESIVCNSTGCVLGIFGSTQEEFLHTNFVKKIRSYNTLKNGEVFRDSVKVVLVEEPRKIEKVEKPKLKLVYRDYKMDSIGDKTLVRDIDGKLLFVGDVIQFKDGDASVVCTKQANIMGIWDVGHIENAVVRHEIRKVKSYTELKAGETYYGMIKVEEIPNPKVDIDEMLKIGRAKLDEAVKLMPDPKSITTMVKHTINGTTTTVTLQNGRKGVAKLFPDDTFDVVEGFRIAYARACGQDAFKDFISDKPLEAFSDKELLQELALRLIKRNK